MDKQESIFGKLKCGAEYAQRSYSERLLYQAYGKAQMARQLGAITKEEFAEINEMTIHFMNTDREYIRYRDKAYPNSCDAGNGDMTLSRLVRLGVVTDGTEVYVRPGSGFGLLARGNWYQDHLLEYMERGLGSFTWQDGRKIYIDLKEKEGPMKEYRVKFWLGDEDGREDFMEFGTMGEAQAFYDSLDGKAEIQKYVDRLHAYGAAVSPTFEV